jgi:hypothetical protein
LLCTASTIYVSSCVRHTQLSHYLSLLSIPFSFLLTNEPKLRPLPRRVCLHCLILRTVLDAELVRHIELVDLTWVGFCTRVCRSSTFCSSACQVCLDHHLVRHSFAAVVVNTTRTLLRGISSHLSEGSVVRH